jgi:hypothetical protein
MTDAAALASSVVNSPAAIALASSPTAPTMSAAVWCDRAVTVRSGTGNAPSARGSCAVHENGRSSMSGWAISRLVPERRASSPHTYSALVNRSRRNTYQGWRLPQLAHCRHSGGLSECRLSKSRAIAGAGPRDCRVGHWPGYYREFGGFTTRRRTALILRARFR